MSDSAVRAPIYPFVLIDAVLVIAFAAIGRASHSEALGVLDVLGTAWPFLAALLLAWVIVRLTDRDHSAVWPAGVIIWVVTVSSGLALRILFGDTAALPFVIVATITLAVFLLVPRLVWQLIRRRRPAKSGAEPAANTER